jgi:hypothetical protein
VQSRPRWPLEPFPSVLPDPSGSGSGVGNESAVDRVADASLQRAECFFAGLAFVDLAEEVRAARSGVRHLGDRGDMQRVVQLTVPTGVQPVTHTRPR